MSMPDYQFDKIKSWFLAYVAGYLQGDADQRYHIELKRRHSLRVCAQMKHLAQQLNLGHTEIETARIIGLLHDVGRFEQYARFQTYFDSISFDHAAASAEIIQNKGLLADLPPALQEQVICAIRHHNKAAVPPELSGSRLFWTRMIRDGDKLDIWRIVLSDYCSPAHGKENGSGLFKNYSQNPEITDKVYAAVMNATVVNMGDAVTLNDLKLMQMAWIFDLNFRPALQMVRRRRYLEKIYNTMPADPRIMSAYRHIKEYLQKSRRTGDCLLRGSG